MRTSSLDNVVFVILLTSFSSVSHANDPFGIKPLESLPVSPDGYPMLHSVMKTSFQCKDGASGYFADAQAACQIYHVCYGDGRKSSFLCTNGTVFNQNTLVCDWWYKVDCKPHKTPVKIVYLVEDKNAQKTTEKPRIAEPETQVQVPISSRSGRARSFRESRPPTPRWSDDYSGNATSGFSTIVPPVTVFTEKSFERNVKPSEYFDVQQEIHKFTSQRKKTLSAVKNVSKTAAVFQKRKQHPASSEKIRHYSPTVEEETIDPGISGRVSHNSSITEKNLQLTVMPENVAKSGLTDEVPYELFAKNETNHSVTEKPNQYLRLAEKKIKYISATEKPIKDPSTTEKPLRGTVVTENPLRYSPKLMERKRFLGRVTVPALDFSPVDATPGFQPFVRTPAVSKVRPDNTTSFPTYISNIHSISQSSTPESIIMDEMFNPRVTPNPYHPPISTMWLLHAQEMSLPKPKLEKKIRRESAREEGAKKYKIRVPRIISNAHADPKDMNVVKPITISMNDVMRMRRRKEKKRRRERKRKRGGVRVGRERRMKGSKESKPKIRYPMQGKDKDRHYRTMHVPATFDSRSPNQPQLVDLLFEAGPASEEVQMNPGDPTLMSLSLMRDNSHFIKYKLPSTGYCICPCNSK